MEIKSGKMVKNLEVCLLKKKTSALEVKFFPFGEIFFNLTLKFGMHHKKALFLCCLRSLLVTYMIILSLEKEVIVLEKIWKKS